MSTTINVEIDLASEIPSRYLGSDEDGPQYGSMTMQDAIIEAAVDRLLKSADGTLSKKVAELVEDRVLGLVDAELPAIFAHALNESVEVTDEWGNKARSKTMRETIALRVQEQVKVSGRNSYNESVLDKVIREQVDYSLRDIFTKEVEAAKTALRERLTTKAAELLAAETLRGAGVR